LDGAGTSLVEVSSEELLDSPPHENKTIVANKIAQFRLCIYFSLINKLCSMTLGIVTRVRLKHAPKASVRCFDLSGRELRRVLVMALELIITHHAHANEEKYCARN
jgi:hypothetical protein